MRVGAILLGATLAMTLTCGGAKAGLIDLNGSIGPVQFKFKTMRALPATRLHPVQ
jgi:hypothetical protein